MFELCYKFFVVVVCRHILPTLAVRNKDSLFALTKSGGSVQEHHVISPSVHVQITSGSQNILLIYTALSTVAVTLDVGEGGKRFCVCKKTIK